MTLVFVPCRSTFQPLLALPRLIGVFFLASIKSVSANLVPICDISFLTADSTLFRFKTRVLIIHYTVSTVNGPEPVKLTVAVIKSSKDAVLETEVTSTLPENF